MNVANLSAVGISTRDKGQVVFGGPALALLQALDQALLRLASRWSARELVFPPVLGVQSLCQLDYFHAFPHLANFPVSLEASEQNLRRFAEGVDSCCQSLSLTETAPVDQVLTPAACYHIYVEAAHRTLAAPEFYTTRGTCFRREQQYQPLRRQWSFQMRELVAMGSQAEVDAFLTLASGAVGKLVEELGLPVDWQSATDPFFQPKRNAQYLMQLTEPSKKELVFGGDLALASVNFHRQHFGETFAISRAGEAAFSGCVAFGLERWIAAIIDTHGDNPQDWPDLSRVFRHE